MWDSSLASNLAEDCRDVLVEGASGVEEGASGVEEGASEVETNVEEVEEEGRGG